MAYPLRPGYIWRTVSFSAHDDPRISIIFKDKMDVDEYSAFDRTGLSSLLRERGVEEVWIGGLATDYCVKHTALDAVREGFKVNGSKRVVVIYFGASW